MSFAFQLALLGRLHYSCLLIVFIAKMHIVLIQSLGEMGAPPPRDDEEDDYLYEDDEWPLDEDLYDELDLARERENAEGGAMPLSVANAMLARLCAIPIPIPGGDPHVTAMLNRDYHHNPQPGDTMHVQLVRRRSDERRRQEHLAELEKAREAEEDE